MTTSSSNTSPEAGQDRLTQLHEFLDTLDEQAATNTENWFLGALAARVSDFDWNAALDDIKGTFTPGVGQ